MRPPVTLNKETSKKEARTRKSAAQTKLVPSQRLCRCAISMIGMLRRSLIASTRLRQRKYAKRRSDFIAPLPKYQKKSPGKEPGHSPIFWVFILSFFSWQTSYCLPIVFFFFLINQFFPYNRLFVVAFRENVRSRWMRLVRHGGKVGSFPLTD